MTSPSRVVEVSLTLEKEMGSKDHVVRVLAISGQRTKSCRAVKGSHQTKIIRALPKKKRHQKSIRAFKKTSGQPNSATPGGYFPLLTGRFRHTAAEKFRRLPLAGAWRRLVKTSKTGRKSIIFNGKIEHKVG